MEPVKPNPLASSNAPLWMCFPLSSLIFDISSNSARLRPIIFEINSTRVIELVSYVPTSFPFLSTVIRSEIS